MPINRVCAVNAGRRNSRRKARRRPSPSLSTGSDQDAPPLKGTSIDQTAPGSKRSAIELLKELLSAYKQLVTTATLLLAVPLLVWTNLPKVEIEVSDPFETTDALTAKVKIKNSSSYALADVTVALGLCRIVSGVVIQTAGENCLDQSRTVLLIPALWSGRSIGAGKFSEVIMREGLTVKGGGMLSVWDNNRERFREANLSMIVFFRPWFLGRTLANWIANLWPSFLQEELSLYGQRTESGKVVWTVRILRS